MTAVVFVAGEVGSAAKFNEIANAADAASTAAAGMQSSADAAALSAQHASDQAVVATSAATNTTSFATAAATNAAAAAASATAAGISSIGATGAFNVGRNKIHNAMFNIAQRGAGPWTTSGYTLDRWLLQVAHSNGSVNVNQATLSDADRTAIGDEDAQNSLFFGVTGGTGTSDFDFIQQRIENVRRLAGKIVTVSFWAKAATGAPKVGVSIDQIFGTGGSPSSAVNGTGTALTLSTTLARYTATFTIPSITGKTLGTNGDNFTGLNLWASAGSTLNTRSGSIGVQSNTVAIWGVQLEIGNVATALEKLDIATDAANCFRFYQTAFFKLFGWAGSAGQVSDYLQPFVAFMRGNPIVNFTANTQINAAATVGQFGSQAVEVIATANGVGAFGISGTFTASADL